MDHKQKSHGNIPIVNLGEVGYGFKDEPSEAEWRRVGSEMVQAFTDIGFVYLTHHGIPEDVIQGLQSSGGAFFALSDDIKKKYSRNPITSQGYVAADQEKLDHQMGRYELRECYDVTSREGTFPEELPLFKASVGDFIQYSLILVKNILLALEVGLGLESGKLIETHRFMCSDKSTTCLRIIHYPPVPHILTEDAIRIGKHTDYGTFSLLYQDDVGGLEVRTRSGKWISAEPMAGSILVIVGDLLQMWTADKLTATEHRVLVPREETKQKKCRRSTVFFIRPDDHVIVQPFDGSDTYPPVSAKEHVEGRYAASYQY